MRKVVAYEGARRIGADDLQEIIDLSYEAGKKTGRFQICVVVAIFYSCIAMIGHYSG